MKSATPEFLLITENNATVARFGTVLVGSEGLKNIKSDKAYVQSCLREV